MKLKEAYDFIDSLKSKNDTWTIYPDSSLDVCISANDVANKVVWIKKDDLSFIIDALKKIQETI